MMASFRDHRGDQRGVNSIEAAIALPLLFLFLALVIAGGRIGLAKMTVTSSAQAGARAASLERTAAEAQVAAQEVVAAQLNEVCTPRVTASTEGFAVPVGQPASVSTTVACTANLSDVALPGLPGTITLRGAGSSPLDTYRGRG